MQDAMPTAIGPTRDYLALGSDVRIEFAIVVPGEQPVLTFESNTLFGALRFQGERFEVDKHITVGPSME